LILGLVFYGVWIPKAVTKGDLKLIARVVQMPGWLIKAAGRFVGR
jgi:hypothetical protein